jgi:hypothetical protein
MRVRAAGWVGICKKTRLMGVNIKVRMKYVVRFAIKLKNNLLIYLESN